jgi:S1-C subfamily serine protease
MQGFGSCSGVILQTNLVLTCAHCVEDKGEIKVSGKPAKLMKIDKQADLALLLVETISIDQISLADAEVGQDVFSLGYPYSSPNMVFTRGYVSVIQMDAVFATTTCMPGSSGSPLFDSSGNLVSITNGYMVVNSQISVSCLSSVLKEFLGRQK